MSLSTRVCHSAGVASGLDVSAFALATAMLLRRVLITA